MKISADGIRFIERYEGCKLHAYQDSIGIWTIGVGHTSGITEGMTITQAQADEYLAQDIQWVEKCINGALLVPVTQEQFDALCSFVFNLGCGTLRTSRLLKLLNSGDDAGAAMEFQKYNHAGGQVVAGLTRRRNEEMNLFLS